jgi:hypothetical protein
MAGMFQLVAVARSVATADTAAVVHIVAVEAVVVGW